MSWSLLILVYGVTGLLISLGSYLVSHVVWGSPRSRWFGHPYVLTGYVTGSVVIVEAFGVLVKLTSN